MTSSSSAAARPASGSSATPPCGASGRCSWSGSTWARAPPAASTACCTRAVATSSPTRSRRPSAPRRARSCGASPPTPSRTPGACSSRRRPTTPATPSRSSRAAGRPAWRSRRSPWPRPSPASRGSTRASAAPSRCTTGRSTRGSCCGATPARRASTARRILTYHWVTSILRDGDRVVGAVARDDRGGEDVRIEAAFTINAGGVWAGQIADMAGCHGVTVVPGKGIMIAMNHRLVSTVINRCDPPGDGDILVPIRTTCVIGTTDVKADDPDDLEHRPRRGAADARRGRGHRPRLPRGAGHARLGRRAAPLPRRARLRGRGRHPAHEPRPRGGRPRQARRGHRLPHHHGRQAHDLPAHGARSWSMRCAPSSARSAAAAPRTRCCRAPRAATTTGWARAWPSARPSSATTRSSASAS